MKKIVLLLMIMMPFICKAHDDGRFEASDFLKELKEGDKAAILMVHFGTTYDQTRALTIDAINKKVKDTFSELETREAYTSRIVLRRLHERGIEKQNPVDALLKLRADGYTHIIIQSTNIIDGVEMEAIYKDIAIVQPFFKEIRVGTPLLYTVQDYENIVEILKQEYTQKGDIILVGHGTYTPSTATYAMLDYMLKDKGINNFHVGTVEGYPSYDEVLRLLKGRKVKQATLAPFMFVAGDHANNDIAGEWKENLEKDGFKADVVMKGLGEYEKIQDIFINKIRFILHHKMTDITKKKKAYAEGKDAH